MARAPEPIADAPRRSMRPHELPRRFRLPGAPYVAARFVRRPNRFIVQACLTDGQIVNAHLADPGRLRELLVPGARLRLRPATTGGRRTDYTVSLVRDPAPPHAWVSVETLLPNRLVEPRLRLGGFRGLGPAREVQREVRVGASRLDFLVEDGKGRCLVEVKSVTLVVGASARFPDAPTVRGLRHLQELTAHAQAGGRAMVVFVVQRWDARAVRPNPRTDPAFTDALRRARRAGVMLRAVRFRLDPRGTAEDLGTLPVRLSATPV